MGGALFLSFMISVKKHVALLRDCGIVELIVVLGFNAAVKVDLLT